MPERYGLIGYPLTHSFSRKYFEDKFKKEGIRDCTYDLFPLQSIDELPGLIRSVFGLRGLNVTIPYKQEVMAYLDNSDGIPPGLDACNCIRIDEEQLSGFNTDWVGFYKSLRPLLGRQHRQALILGSGGASRAVCFALEKLGIGYSLAGRWDKTGVLSYGMITTEMVSECTLIINTTPLGMFPDVDSYPPLPYQALTSRHLLFDLIYNPEVTVFMRKGIEAGATVCNGMEMLAIQAEESWRIWRSQGLPAQ